MESYKIRGKPSEKIFSQIAFFDSLIGNRYPLSPVSRASIVSVINR